MLLFIFGGPYWADELSPSVTTTERTQELQEQHFCSWQDSVRKTLVESHHSHHYPRILYAVIFTTLSKSEGVLKASSGRVVCGLATRKPLCGLPPTSRELCSLT